MNRNIIADKHPFYTNRKLLTFNINSTFFYLNIIYNYIVIYVYNSINKPKTANQDIKACPYLSFQESDLLVG